MAMKRVVLADDLSSEELAAMEAYMAEEARFERGRIAPPAAEVPPPHPLVGRRPDRGGRHGER